MSGNEEVKREQLRRLMADCPACEPEEEADVPPEQLDAWIRSHGEEPVTEAHALASKAVLA